MFGFFDFSLVRKLILEFKSLRLIFFCSLLTFHLHLKHLALQLLDLGLCFKQCLLCLVELVTKRLTLVNLTRLVLILGGHESLVLINQVD